MTIFGKSGPFPWLAALTLSLFAVGPVSATVWPDIGSTSVAYGNSTSASVTLHQGAYSPKSDEKYQLCWKSPNQIGNPCLHNHVDVSAPGPDPTANLGGLTLGQTYVIGGQCRCKNNASSLNVYVWRDITSTTYTHLTPPPPGPLVRLRSISNNQCAYLYGGSGRHWVCWADPNMRFEVRTFAPGVYNFRHVGTGPCLVAPTAMSGAVTGGGCGTLAAMVMQVPIGGGMVQLKFLHAGGPFGSSAQGGCLYAPGGDGGYLLRAPCSGDAKFSFILDPA